MGPPKLTKFKRVYQRHLNNRDQLLLFEMIECLMTLFGILKKTLQMEAIANTLNNDKRVQRPDQSGPRCTADNQLWMIDKFNLCRLSEQIQPFSLRLNRGFNRVGGYIKHRHLAKHRGLNK